MHCAESHCEGKLASSWVAGFRLVSRRGGESGSTQLLCARVRTAEMATSAAASAQGAVEEAIRIAQDAVRSDEAGDFDEAVALYTKAVDLIKRGLQIQREDESVDNTVLHRYAKLYSDRIAVLAEHSRGRGAGPSSSSGGAGGSAFSFDDEEIAGAQPPGPAPAEEWRRPFWLMRILRTSMSRGGFLSPDRRVYVAKRVWLQKGARFIALQAITLTPTPTPNLTPGQAPHHARA